MGTLSLAVALLTACSSRVEVPDLVVGGEDTFQGSDAVAGAPDSHSKADTTDVAPDPGPTEPDVPEASPPDVPGVEDTVDDKPDLVTPGDPGCTPDCEGKSCGDDGCGGHCGGECGPGLVCDEAGSCALDLVVCADIIAECVPEGVLPIPAEGVCNLLSGAPECASIVVEAYETDGCAIECGGIPVPGLPKACESDACSAILELAGSFSPTPPCDGCESMCQPQCGGLVCGPDGCGGWCGECGFGEQCNDQGACSEVPECVPGSADCACIYSGCVSPEPPVPSDVACPALQMYPACMALIAAEYEQAGCGMACGVLVVPGKSAICTAPECAVIKEGIPPILGWDPCDYCPNLEPDNPGQCVGEGDQAVLKENGAAVTAQAVQCGLECADSDDVAACTQTCLSELWPTLSDGCGQCYVGLASCSAAFCSPVCAGDPASPDCVYCQGSFSCTAELEACAGP